MGNSRLRQVENYQSGGNRIKMERKSLKRVSFGSQDPALSDVGTAQIQESANPPLAYALQGCALVGYEGMPSDE